MTKRPPTPPATLAIIAEAMRAIATGRRNTRRRRSAIRRATLADK